MVSETSDLVKLLSEAGTLGVGLAIGAVPVLVGAAIYVTRMGSQAKIDRLEGEIQRLERERTEANGEADVKYRELQEKYQTALRRGPLLQAQLDAIVGEMELIAPQVDAAEYSILVPAPTSIADDEPDQLVFLCASGPNASKLQWVRVPVDTSLSGKVFLSGQPTIASPSVVSESFAKKVDHATEFKTDEVLSIPLRFRGKCIGVAQFLNRRAGQFNSDDIRVASNACATVALRVGDIISDPKRLVELGHAPRTGHLSVAVMFIDISEFSNFCIGVDDGVVVTLLNEYFTELCSIAYRYGAVVDQYMGDGALIVFNVEQNTKGYIQKALSAAREMRAAFGKLRLRWSRLGYPGSDRLFIRISLSSGEVNRAEIGHRQSRRMTFLGQSVNDAAHACDRAPRGRDTICVTDEVNDALCTDMEFSTEQLRGTTPTLHELAN